MRAQPDLKGPWYHGYFLDREIARHHATCLKQRSKRAEAQGERGRIVKWRKNGAGYEVFWRYKKARRRKPSPV
jgi:hypothetical protein